MDLAISDLIEQIAQLPPNWHAAGSVSVDALRAIADYARTIGPIRHSIETGSGKTTLLLSHLSAHHVVFAVDAGNSISQVRNCPLFNAANVTYVEGPTQLTLPHFDFLDQVQIALIDGPHGYPFPDLEYYYFYPVIANGGLLVVDDIKIPSIARMYEIIKADDMFELLDVIDDNMAIFRRTAAPMTNPRGDDWWQQGYNRAHYAQLNEDEPAAPPMVRRVLRRVSGMIPKGLKRHVPAGVKQRIWKKM